MATTINSVLGQITDRNDRPLANLRVEIYNVDMREWLPLAETRTDKGGNYDINWSAEKLSKNEKKTADIGIIVRTSEKGTELFKSSIDQVRFNASKREEINITIKREIPSEVIEFNFLVEEVSSLAEKVAIADLRESVKNRDVTFLSKELEVQSDKIEHLVVAHRLNKLSKIDAAFFYALFRKNTLLHSSLSKNLNARFSIGIGVDDQTLLYDAALTDFKKIEVDIKAAVKEKIISRAELKNVKNNLKILLRLKKKATDYYEKEHPEQVINVLSNFFKEDKLGEIQKLFKENRNDLNGFFSKVTDPSFFPSKEKESDARTNIGLGKIFGFGNEIIPSIAKSRGIKKSKDIRKLALLNKADWVKEIKKSKSKLKDKELISTLASTMVRKMEREFPTLAFSSQLDRAKKPVLKNQKDIVSFFKKHEDFDLMKDNVDLFLKKKRVSKKTNEAINAELKSVQRIFKLTPNYTKTLALRKEKIHSAQSIVSIGKVRFVDEIAPKAGIDEKEAKEIFSKAETKHTAAMMMVGDLQDSMSVKDIAAFETTTLAKTLESVSGDFPNLKSLFKLADTCECEHCRSVYSPAAYLVEILQFLDKRMVVANNAKSILFQRRPELGDIDLGCANANTPVKYIDLVCEILEEAISPDPGINYTGVLSTGADPLKGVISNALLTALQAAGLTVTSDALIFATESSSSAPHYLRDQNLVCKIENTGGSNYTIYRLRQTFGTAAELDAAPEYVNESAYVELADKTFAFTLPFDLQHTEAKEYFSRFDVNRTELMRAFQTAATPSDENISAEKLNLTDSEWNIIASSPAPNNNAAQQDYWNVPAPGVVVDYMKNVDQFLDRTGINYKELDLLLKLNFIDPAGNLFIQQNDLSCDTAAKEIANLDLDALDRIHRFLRLQKITGWQFEVLDAIIVQVNLGSGTLDQACLIKAAEIKEISDQTTIKIEELIGCFGEIPHSILQEDGQKPLYHQVFLNKAKNGVIIDELLPENVDGSQLIDTHLGYISTCLQLKQTDLEFLTPLLPDGDLTFSNLSYLLASSRILTKLKLNAEDFAIISEMSAISISGSPEKTLEFLKINDDFNSSPFNADDVKYLLNHEATNLIDREITVEKIEELLGKLKTGYEGVNEELKSKFDTNLEAELQIETLTTVLTSALGKEDADGITNSIQEADVTAILKFVDRDWRDVVNVAGAKTYIDDTFNDAIDRTTINAALDALAALAVDADASSEQLDLVQAFMDSIAPVQLTIGKKEFLELTISDGFKVELELASILLQYAKLKQPLPGTDVISTLLSDDFDNPITVGNYPKQYDTIRLLNKTIVLLDAFKTDDSDAEWYLKNNANPAVNWFEFDNVPYKAGQTAQDLNKYLNFSKIVSYSKQFTAVIDPLDAEKSIDFFTITEMILLGAGADRDEFLTKLALLTSYEKTDLDAIDAHLSAAFDITNYNKSEVWSRVLECAEFVRKLGAEVSQIVDYIKPVLTTAEVSDLRATLKSRYDEDTWLKTLKEIMDAVRPQKRNALVAYLLATNPEMKDENDLYEYFLVDVEMEACMPSSRIVQAHNSIQLFVQRCLMGLEPDAIADVDKDPNWDQWKWMKNYRVWEANRKVFLYPESWYDVTLTGDKTYLLDEFISEIQQNELTNDTAEEAIKKYVKKLDDIAFLEVMATWYETPTRNMHVFARTKGGDPSIYYYRRFESERYWTPWEKVELDISGDHLLAFVRNNRLHLAWPMFSEEAKPDQESTMPSATAGSPIPNDKPKKKLKIQLAISEYSNEKWQPKRISKEAVLTPSDYTNVDSHFNHDKYSLIYFESEEQVHLISTNWDGKDYYRKNGVFDIAGCKGYPELVFQGDEYLPDFYPDFSDAILGSQKYTELSWTANDDLSVRNGMSPINFYEILKKTPSKFRITYPHQFTSIDLIALMREYFLLIVNSFVGGDNRFQPKLPLGTMLPYFEENNKRGYVAIPGFYKKEQVAGAPYTLNDSEKRTASNVFQLSDDIANWFKKIKLEFQINTPTNTQDALHSILADSDFQGILMELSKYANLDFILNLLVGATEDPDVDEFLTELIQEEPLAYGEQFKNMYHPLVCALRTVLNNDGVSGLMKRDTQLFRSDKVDKNTKPYFEFKDSYQPNEQIVPKAVYKNETGVENIYPIEDLDFTSDGSYSEYNWDLFFRVPLHIATSLTKNQRFEEALTWFHYMFNPTGALSGTGVQKYWVTKPFYLNQETDYVSQRIDSLMYATADLSNPAIKELEFAIDEWRKKPFRPDVIARSRPVAYQKALLMKYIDNLTEWGDYLFRQDTMESVAQATQMYVLADKLLGPKPRIVPAVIKQPYETYNQIEAKLDSFGNALIEMENILPDFNELPEGVGEIPAPAVTLGLLYFCIPANEQMFEYWDRVADRLFKIRHCQNIDGVERSLALFAPPIDPGMLVRAAASGLDLSSIIAGLNAPTSYYRFNVLSQKATTLAQEVRLLGSSLLQALEKKDAEAISLLRSKLELKVLTATTDIKTLQINEAIDQIEVLERTKIVTEERRDYYSSIEKINTKEQLNLDKLGEANDYQVASQVVKTVAGALRLIPEFHVGASGFGGSPQVVMQLGGSAISTATNIGADILNILSSVASFEANRASILGGYNRRFDDWNHQENLATLELSSIDKQIDAANIRKEIAETDLKNHELQIENSKTTDEFMRSKFTNKELYDWMIGEISSVYFSAYKLSHDFAKKAERSYRFELGNDDSFISYGYWDSMKKGLLSADYLIHDINRMETSYLDKNKREYELTKHVSLAQLDPLALVRLRATGICDFDIPEALYDMDHSGQYFRRIKSVSVSLPCIAGPYTSVSVKLSLVNNRYRNNTNDPVGYVEDVVAGDPRFVYNVGSIQSIATSSSQNDSGVFELNFNDQRYLPFENTGAISGWRLELPTEIKQFDYNTISDVIMHVKYTAREGGSGLKTNADLALKTQLEAIKQDLSQTGMHLALNMKHELPNEWHLLKKDGSIDLMLDKTIMPYMVQSLDTTTIESVMFVAKIKDNPATFTINVNAVATNLSTVNELELCTGINSDIDLDTLFMLSVSNADNLKLEELLLIVKYRF